MPKPLTPEQINMLIKEEEEKPKRGSSAKQELIEVRVIQNWFKLSHHICTTECPHREQAPHSTGRACWNPDCTDTRTITDRGSQIVAEVKGQWICRYCYLAGYLKT